MIRDVDACQKHFRIPSDWGRSSTPILGPQHRVYADRSSALRAAALEPRGSVRVSRYASTPRTEPRPALKSNIDVTSRMDY